MARFCSNCGNEVDEKAVVCVRCGNNLNQTNNNLDNKKKKAMPVWAIILIVFGSIFLVSILIFFSLAIIGYGIYSYDLKEDNYLEEVLEPEIINSGIGEKIETDDYNITLTKVLTYDSIESEYLTDKPAEGKEYVVLFFDIENTSDENLHVSDYYFNSYVDDMSVNNVYLYNKPEDVDKVGFNIAPGKINNGYIAYEVDKNWKEFETHFSNSFSLFDDTEVVFKFENTDDNE